MSLRISIVPFAIAVLLLNVLPLHSQIVSEKSTLAEVERNWKAAGWEIPSGWSPVMSDSDAQAWGDQLTKAIAAKDTKSFTNSLFDSDQLLNDSVAGIPEGRYKSGFTTGVESAMQNNLATMIASPDFSVRRTRNTKFGPTVLTRLLNEDGSVAYVLWRLLKNKDGDVKAVDMLSLGVGEWTSQILARAAVVSMPKEASVLQKLTGKQMEISKGQEQFLKLAQAQQGKDFKSVLSLYAKMPMSLKNEKFIQLIRLNAAMQVDDDEYLKAIQNFKKTHPNDVASLLHSIDFYFLKEDFQSMRGSIDSIIDQIGPDSHLYNLKAVGYSSENNHAEAAKVLKLAIKTEPKREDNYWSLVETSLSAGDLDTVNACLKSLVTGFGFKEFDFEASEIYKPFLGSPQHKDFVEFLKNQ